MVYVELKELRIEEGEWPQQPPFGNMNVTHIAEYLKIYT